MSVHTRDRVIIFHNAAHIIAKVSCQTLHKDCVKKKRNEEQKEVDDEHTHKGGELSRLAHFA